MLRLEIRTDGEIVEEAKPHIGYLHRCFEKHAENLPYPQVIPFTDRMDYLAAMNNNMGYVLAVEKLLGLEIPERVEYIRVIMCELNRIASHLVSFGTYGMDIGAFTPFLFAFREREDIFDLFEMTCGARMLYNYIWVGGVSHDLPPGFVERCRHFLAAFEGKLKEYNDLLTYNKIFIERTANVGVLALKSAYSHNITGPNLRGCGVKWDLRRDEPYSIYDRFEFDVPFGRGRDGDSWRLLGPVHGADSRNGAKRQDRVPGAGSVAGGRRRTGGGTPETCVRPKTPSVTFAAKTPGANWGST